MNYAYQSSSDDSRALPLNAQYGSIPQKAFLRSSLVLPSPAKLDTKGKYSFDEEALKAIKSELYKGHGVSLAINVSHNGFIQDNMASYYDGNNAADHTLRSKKFMCCSTNTSAIFISRSSSREIRWRTLKCSREQILCLHRAKKISLRQRP